MIFMRGGPIGRQRRQPTWLRYLLVGLIGLGIAFRFINLDKKVYWHDEVYTSLRISAHTRTELVEQTFTGNTRTPGSILQYQEMAPDRTMWDAIRFLGMEDAQHPPVYYAIARLWVQVWGHSVTIVRSLSALLSLLIFPGVYWLCRELFDSPWVGWVAMALIAISPFHVLFAQEAREYELWAVTILLCSAALLRAMRLNTRTAWGLYGVLLILSIYTFILSVLVAIGHGLYVLARNHLHPLSLLGFRLTRTTLAYLMTTAIALVGCIPWGYYLVTYADTVQATAGWVNTSIPLVLVAQLEALNFARIFADFDLSLQNPVTHVLIVPLVFLQLYALYYLGLRAPQRAWLFILSLVAATYLTLALPDLLLGGQRSVVTRYLIPCYLGMQIAVAFFVADRLNDLNVMRRRIGQLVFASLIGLGVLSCGVSSQADTWWNKVVSYYNPQIAETINQSQRPILISDAFGINPGNIVSLSYLLNPNVQLLLLPEVSKNPVIPDISDLNRDVFLLNLPETFRDELSTRYQASAIPVVGQLWRLQR